VTGRGLRRDTRRFGVPSPWDLAWAGMPKEDRRLPDLREGRRWFEDYLKTGGCGGNGDCECSAQSLSWPSSRWGA
jgi:hypothetical protein